ncbi:GNAT family N-acetyltransferase [Simiduia agarivorans]|uniref:GNAT family N-acetyltransferase n=1 Tax=Simiduia agarivorans (strain DSM 21679 / JCM 13881 / BCRC 17597 / SA1) TaxID=1117647 RepID=K4L0M9_SIMAS|nr:GNAT family N-acetyltransferase [Simiduia agarivorans]AFU99687.2 hypothetical protein M5M_12675 [Simiduia agarivorans SA1 = DSM 21679]
MHCQFLTSIHDIPEAEWQTLLGSDYPFLQYAFLSALETSGCVGEGTGWHPHYLWVTEAQVPVAAAPLFIKTDSWGEYVFDWAWADAFRRAGRAYYPKWVCAIPFTPASGPRLLGTLTAGHWPALQQQLEQQAHNNAISSLHWLLSGPDESAQLAPRWRQRQGTQFHWFNHGFKDFAGFLATFNARKRKSLLRERRKVAEAGITLTRKTGADITAADWEHFYACYRHTYAKRSGHAGYLNRAFFQTLSQSLAHQVMLVQAEREGQLIASALNFFDAHTLYGRYWGCLEEWDCLHFEACYYQGIEFAIEQKLTRFDPGAQGEHKIQRGFTPVPVVSNHWIKDADARAAIDQFIETERRHNEAYLKAAADLLPFRQ